MQLIYLGGNPRKLRWVSEEVSQEREDSKIGCVIKPVTTVGSGDPVLEDLWKMVLGPPLLYHTEPEGAGVFIHQLLTAIS